MLPADSYLCPLARKYFSVSCYQMKYTTLFSSNYKLVNNTFNQNFNSLKV